MVLSVSEYESMCFARNAHCLERCSKAGHQKIHEWPDETDAISFEDAVRDFHRVATVESEGAPYDAVHYVFRLNPDGSVTFVEERHTAQGFKAFSRTLGDSLACLCCRHPLKVVDCPPDA